MTDRSLDGCVAMITGAGSGIGRATALAMARCGARVALADLPIRASATRQLVTELRSSGCEAMDIALDVRNTISITNVVDTIYDTLGGLDILVNNAGVQTMMPAVDFTEEAFDHVVGVNLKGAFFCSQAAGAIMLEQGCGSIVNVASQHGVVGNHNRAAYCASKGGLVNLTRALAVEWGGQGVRVNAVSPTFVANGTNDEYLARPEVLAEIRAGISLGRAATTDEVAAGICFLASPQSQMINGHNLLIDGGWTAR